MFKLNLSRKPKFKGEIVTARLNARLQPMHRGEHFDDPLMDALTADGLGEITGGGTQLAQDREGIVCSDLEIAIPATDEATISALIEKLEALGAPKGSTLIVENDGREFPFGKNEGVAVYLNGVDLPDEVYRNCNLDEVVETFDRLLQGKGKFMSFWQGERETALYLYGRCFDEMTAAIAPFMASYPLCRKSRVEQIA
jgi:hypothetical protein